jgi:hypothetical protein
VTANDLELCPVIGGVPLKFLKGNAVGFKEKGTKPGKVALAD